LKENYLEDFLFDETQQTIDILIPDNGLNPEYSTSWKIDDFIFESFEDVMETYVDSLKIWFDFL